MISIDDLSRQISIKDWDDRLAKISTWRFDKVKSRSNSPTCLFTIVIRVDPNVVPGFEKVMTELHVDQNDLMRPEFRNQSDPESAYVNYAKAQFSGNFLVKMAQAMINHRARAAASASSALIKKPEIKKVTSPQLERLRYNLAKRGFIPTKENPHPKYADKNYKDYPLLSWT